METLPMPRILLIAGTGRNSGKTTMACAIIKKFSKQNLIIAIKISPHFHKIVSGTNVVFSNNQIYIEEEVDTTTGKDSSLMLAAGAQKSFFVMANDNYLDLALKKILSLNPENVCYVCESGGLRKYVLPGLFIILNRESIISNKNGIESLIPLADIFISAKEDNLDKIIDSIELDNYSWKLNLK
jgi:hypothetical protein